MLRFHEYRDAPDSNQFNFRPDYLSQSVSVSSIVTNIQSLRH